MDLERVEHTGLESPILPASIRPLRERRLKQRFSGWRDWKSVQPCLILGLTVFLGACATTPMRSVHDALPPDSPRGYIEFYCSQCITGWAVYEMKDGQETYLSQLDLGRQVADTIRSPSRAKRLRIAHSPGAFDFIIRLLPRERLAGPSLRFEVDILQDRVTPIRLEFQPQTEIRFDWDIVVGQALPLEAMDPMQDTLAAALDDSDWGARWYAAQSLEHPEEGLSEPALDRLAELSSAEGYDTCLNTSSVIECSLIQDQAARVLDKMRPKNENEK